MRCYLVCVVSFSCLAIIFTVFPMSTPKLQVPKTKKTLFTNDFSFNRELHFNKGLDLHHTRYISNFD